MKNLVKKYIGGVGFTDAFEDEVLEYVINKIRFEVGKTIIFTPNPELVVMASEDESYRKTLNSAEVNLPDGAGILIAAKILGKSLKKRITGVDFVEKVCERIAKEPVTAGFLGGRGDIAVRTGECLKKRFPELKISFSAAEIDTNWKNLSNFPETDMLFVAFGSPKQEIFISNYINKLPVKVMVGVGGAFDMISGEVKRAPKWVRTLGFEWLYRLIIQPWRAKRQLRLLKFVLLVLKEKLFHN